MKSLLSKTKTFLKYYLLSSCIVFTAHAMLKNIEEPREIILEENVKKETLENRVLTIASFNINHLSRGNHLRKENKPYFPKGSTEITKLAKSIFWLAVDSGRLERNLDGIAELVEREDPDILLLQEADWFYPESGFWDTSLEIAKKTGYPYLVWGDKWSYISVTPFITGNAILSKYPITSSTNTPLNNSLQYPLIGGHTVLEADININGEIIRILNTHLLSLSRDHEKKREQVETLLSCVDSSPYPVILGGDFNNSESRMAQGGIRANDPTLPILKKSPLIDNKGFFDPDTYDYIFIRPRDNTEYKELKKSKETSVSDHYLITARIELPYRNLALKK